MKQNYNYDLNIQKLYLELMLADAETFVRCQAIFDHTLFDKKLQLTAEFINSYVEEFNDIPSYEIVNSATNSTLIKPENISVANFDWLLHEFETFIRHKGLERAIWKSSDLLEKGAYGEVEDLIKKAVQIGLQKDLGTDYFLSPKSRLMKIKDKNGQISTGWKNVDEKLFGGMNRGELNIFAGGSGAGKSLFLANLGVNWALMGLNVVYLTFELSEELVSMRIDSMISNIPTKDIFKNIDDVDLKVKMIGKKSGSMQVKYMPSGKTANDIRSYLKEYEIKNGKKVDVLLVDYLDLLMPQSKKISPADLFIKDKYVSEELRNLAVEKNCIFVTASQLNRSAVEEVEFDHSHISGGISKINTADNLFGIFTSRAMRERGKYQIQLMKTRSSSGVGQKIDLDFNIDTLRISDSIDDSDVHTSSDILSDIKNRQTISEPSDGSNAPKIKAEIQSAKLRNLINGIKV